MACCVDCAAAVPSELIDIPGGSSAMTRLALLPEFSTSAVEPLCVDDVLVMVINSSAESDVLSFVAEDVGVMTMKPLSMDLVTGVGVGSS